jgi:hypothetical protein
MTMMIEPHPARSSPPASEALVSPIAAIMMIEKTSFAAIGEGRCECNEQRGEATARPLP